MSNPDNNYKVVQKIDLAVKSNTNDYDACATSCYIIKPVYYDTVLRTRIAQDPESAKMLDQIMDGVRVDAGILHLSTLNCFHPDFRSLMDSNNGNVISGYKMRERNDQ